MLTSKERAKLRGIASTYETIFQVGKGGIGDHLIGQVQDALRKRELIKLRVLENSMYAPREAAEELSAATRSTDFGRSNGIRSGTGNRKPVCVV